jgi:hypothetical protein
MTDSRATAAPLPTVLVFRHHGLQCPPVLERAGTAFLVTDRDPDADTTPSAGAPVSRREARRRHALRRIQMSRYAGIYRISSMNSIAELSAVAAHLLFIDAGIDKVVTHTEQTQYAAGYIAHLLGLDHYSPHLSLYTRDKRAMKTRAAAAGLPVPHYLSLPNAGRTAEIGRIEATVGYPLVLKPANGWGSIHTTLVHGRAELAAALAGVDLHTGLWSDHLVAEEFIAGDEFHADAVWRDGEPWVFFVSRYFTPRLELNTGTGLNGSVMLRPDDHPDLYRQVRELNTRYNAAIGLTRGVTHLEVFRERGTSRLVCSEIASRMAGANFPEVIGAACGVSERVLWAHELLDGNLADLPPLRQTVPGYVGWVNVPAPQTGTVRSLPVQAELLAHPNVLDAQIILAVGQEIPLAWSSTWGVLLVIGAKTEDQLIEVATELTASIKIGVG